MGFPIEPETKNSGGTGAGRPAVERSTEGVASLLAVARQRITEGNPSLALQAVDTVRRGKITVVVQLPAFILHVGRKVQIMMALHATGGEQAVFAALNRARETYHNGSGPSVETDELSALFAEFAIATLPPRPVQAVPEPVVEAPEEMDDSETNEDSILAESGRQQVVVDASSDGSSFVCQQCGGLVSNLRRDEHFTYWCSPPLSN